MTDLLSIQNRVETPFVSVNLGGHTFGIYKKYGKGTNDKSFLSKTYIEYPNFMKSLRINRNASGTVNIYTIEMVYAITEFDDPNLLEKIFSKASKDRKIILTYGDYAHPSYIYREEQALIQKIVPNFNFNSSVINYTITAVSSVLNKAVATYDFAKRKAKPSDVIIEMLYSTEYRLCDVFFGMLDKNKILIDKLIPVDDSIVTLDAQTTSITSYLNYLVNSMVCSTDMSSHVKNNIYRLAFFDDITNEYGGPYFKIVKQGSGNTKSSNLITFDLGYPGESSVLDFRAEVSEIWSILYNYNEEIGQSQTQYIIDDNGDIKTEYVNRLTIDTELYKSTEAEKNWISKMTSFPIRATMTIKGLIKPAILTTNIKVNILFYGKYYILTGTYMIIGQDDSIDSNGYKSVLSLIRVGGDVW